MVAEGLAAVSVLLAVAAIALLVVSLRLRARARQLAAALDAAEEARGNALVLLSVAEAVNSSLSLEDVVDVALARSAQLVRARGGAFYMARGGEVDLTREATFNLAHRSNGDRRPLDSEPARTAATSQRATLVRLAAAAAPALENAGRVTHALVVPVRRGGRLMGAIELYFECDPGLDPVLVDLLHGIAAQTATAIRHAQIYREQEETSLTDELTRLPNRRYLGQRFLQERQRARRGRRPIAVLMLDLDHFKQINDSHGHLVGDAVLVTLAGVLRSTIRESDLAARYGGEEFAVIVHDTTLEGAMRLAGRIRSAVEAAVFPDGLRLTVSVGVAATSDPSRFDELFELADAALYDAKRSGRNQVQAALVEEAEEAGAVTT